MNSWEANRSNSSVLIPRCAKRIQKDICTMVSTPPEGIFAEPDEANIRFMDILIMGPKDTPYEGGMFHFLVEFTNDYPINPPKVKLLTTGNGRVRFNPNLYNCGKVCLSLLGTWSGPGWSPVISLPTLMVAIQSLMNEEPYCNEPAYTNSKDKNAIESYNKRIQYETIRVAAIDVYENRNSYPKTFVSEIEKAFVKNYDFYLKVCNKKINQSMGDGAYDYKPLLKKLQTLKPN